MNKFKNFLKRTGFDEKKFQLECFEWCLERETQGYNVTLAALAEPALAEPALAAAKIIKIHSAILALEMGLGKTIIMLGLIECNFQRHTLIVLPRSLLDQWNKIIQKSFGHKPLIYHGSNPKCKNMTISEIKACPIIITTYGQISLPSAKQIKRGKKQSILLDLAWDRVICDEAHHISHHKTNEYKGACLLRTKIIWLVTGTPIQNNLTELYNLYSLLGLPATYYINYDEAVKNFVFLRTKAGVGLPIPALHEHTEILEWINESERKFADHIHSFLPFCNIAQGAIAQQITDEEGTKIVKIKYMTRARQVCLYPPVINKDIKYFKKLFAKDQKKNTDSYGLMNFPSIYRADSKISAVVNTLIQRKNGNGKIVFCHYYSEIDIFAKRLLLQGFTIAKFDGRVKNSDRARVLSEPVDVLLAQIKMCREGLNLQDNYSEVYFPSPHFNPATEEQAIARCW